MATDTAPRRHTWQLPTFALGAVALACAVWQFPPTPPQPADQFTQKLATLRAVLEKKSTDPVTLEALATSIAAEADQFPGHAATAHYLAGCAFDRLADQTPDELTAWNRAAEQFAAIDSTQLPANEQAALIYKQAKAAAATGTGDAASIAKVLATVPSGLDDPERRRLLALALMRSANPDLPQIKRELSTYLTGPTRLPAAATARLKQKLADVHLALNEPDQARTWLRDLGPAAPPDVQAQAQAQLGRLASAGGRFADAIAHFDLALRETALPAADRAAAQYQAGVAWVKQNDPGKARAFFTQAAESTGDSAQAAKVRLAEILLKSPEFKGRRAEAVEHLRAAVADVQGELANPLVSVAEVRAAFEQAVRVSGDEGDHATASAAATAYSAVAAAGRALEIEADAAAAWAAELKLDPAQATKAVEKFKLAATRYSELAKDFPTPAGQAEFLRKAAKSYRNAGDDTLAVKVIESLTQLDGVPDEIMTAAWVERGEALLASNQFAEGASVLRQAVTAADPTTAVQARVKLATAHLGQAKEMLRTAGPSATEAVRAEAAGIAKLGTDLLDELAKSPADSPTVQEAQQTALFELGKHHLAQNQLPLAEERFRKLVTAYPAGTVADQARLYLGCTLLQLGRGDHQSDRPPANSDQLLAEAAGLFERLGSCDNPFLRTQADIRLANTTFLLKKYDAMPELCDKLAAKYAGSVEELIILSLKYAAERVSGQSSAAAATYNRAEEAFQKLPADAFSDQGDEYTRGFWERWFGQLKPAGQ